MSRHGAVFGSVLRLFGRAAVAASLVFSALVMVVLTTARIAPGTGMLFSESAPTGDRTYLYLDPFSGRQLVSGAPRHPAGAESAVGRAVSPDGTRTVVPRITERGVDLFVQSEGGAELRLTPPSATKGSNTSPAWSPDGDWISFISVTATSQMDLYLVRADGTQLRRVYAELGRRMVPGPRWLTLPGQPLPAVLALAALGGLAAVAVLLRAPARPTPARPAA